MKEKEKEKETEGNKVNILQNRSHTQLPICILTTNLV